jgi:signal transduction histidine kinase
MIRREVLRGNLATVGAFSVLSVLLAVVAWFNLGQRQSADLIVHTLQIESSLNRVLLHLEDAETGQRGFLLTSDENYLAPFSSATARIDAELQHLSGLVADNPVQRQRLSSLTALIQEKLAELNRTIALARNGNGEAARAMVLEGTGKGLMDALRARIGEMNAAERSLLSAREASLIRTSNIVWVVLLVGLGFVVGLAVWVTTRQQRQLTAMVHSREELVDANRRLTQEAERRERIEEQLRQSQKMEAVGQLTGGMAHDFNNMLAIVIGALDIAARRLANSEGDWQRFLEAARDGAQRAAALTHRLLAFSRQQPLTPQVLDANKLVAGMSELLHRTLGGALRLETVLAGGLWRAHVDPSQLENAILNLAINARDAMPEGGYLTIETANAHLDDDYAASHPEVTAGQYVMIAVSDTGAGMAKDVMGRAFDPFFTTKLAGTGTGLGLSQVYGFVKQSGGHIKIYSEVGQGTTVKIYLPRSVGDEAPTSSAAAGVQGQASRAYTILVVEDEELVRRLVVEMLGQLGHSVLQADRASPGLKLLTSHPDIDLLLTDVVMPEVNGRKLAEEARRLRPDLKVLFMTGYTRNAIVHAGVLEPDVQMIAKPFTLDQLAAKLELVMR